MKAPTSQIRFKNTSTLLDYGFTNFEYKQLLNENEPVKSIKVNKGITSPINAIAESNCGAILSKGQDMNIEQSISAPDTIKAPISKGDVIGKAQFTLNGDVIAECNLVACEKVDKINFFSMDRFILDNWLNLLRK